MRKNKTYLVTGGTGFLGSSLVKSLLKKGHNVRVLDNNLRGADRRIKDVISSVELIKGDIRNKSIVNKATKGIDSIVHMAFVNGTEFFYSMPELVLDIGVKGISNILDAAIKNSVSELVYASSSEVYQEPPIVPTPEDVRLIIPDPRNPRYSYAGGKIIGELMALHYGKKYFNKTIIFRPHNVYGPDMGWGHVIPQFILRMNELITTQKTIDFPIQGSGKETRAFCYIDDFTNGLTKVINKGKNLEIYNIGTDSEVSITNVAEKIGNYFNKKITIKTGNLQKGGTSRRCPDIAKIKALGYKPKVDLDEGISKTAKWYLDNLQIKPKEIKNTVKIN